MKFYILFTFSTICFALNTKLLDINKSTLSEQMKEFMAYVIHQNSHEKDGFLFIAINKVDEEYSDFAMQVLNRNGSVIIVNFDKDKNTVPMLNPNHFKFVLTDPEGELSHAEASFRKVRASRAKIILILTKEPLQVFINYVLNSYWKIKCINVIIVYEMEGRIEVVTMNPFLPNKKDRFVNLTATKYSVDLFDDKAKNLHQYKIRALLTYLDRTKIKRVGKKYTGKDYDAIQTIFSHLNGKLEVVNLENVAGQNPWYDSVEVANRSQLKSEILDDLAISILIKSETFTVNDGVVENIYPHTQNDIRALVPKSLEMSQLKVVATIFTPQAWIWYTSMPLVTIAVLLLVQKFFRDLIERHPLIFELWRAFVVNNTARFPANKWKSILFLGALLYGFVINMFVQSKYTSLLATQHYDPDIDTAHQLFTSAVRLYALPNQIKEMTKMYTGTAYEPFLKHLVPARMNEGQSDRVTYDINSTEVYSFLTENDMATYHSRSVEFRKDGKRLYHLVKESIIPTFQSYKVVHGSPLLPMFENRLMKLAEGGFLELWAKRGIYEDTIKGLLYHEAGDKGNDPKAFSLAVFKLPLYLLFFGYAFSALAFLSELCIERRRRPRFQFTH